jgi:hypothetical protein
MFTRVSSGGWTMDPLAAAVSFLQRHGLILSGDEKQIMSEEKIRKINVKNNYVVTAGI